MKKQDRDFMQVIYELLDYAIVKLDHPSWRWETIAKVKQMITIQQRIKDEYLSNP